MIALVKFGTVGRDQRVPDDLEVWMPDGLDAEVIAERVHRHVRPFLGSREVMVNVTGEANDEAGTGSGDGVVIVGGMRVVGSFSWATAGALDDLQVGGPGADAPGPPAPRRTP